MNQSIHNENIHDDMLTPNKQGIIDSGGSVVLEGSSGNAEESSGVIDETTVPAS